MRRYALVWAGVAGAMLVLFAVAQAAHVPLLAGEGALDGRAGWAAAALGLALLVADVALPVPSSAVMVAHGTLFGLAAGTALSLAGSLGCFAVGFALGRRGGPALGRAVPAGERARADRLLRAWGPLAVAASRPVPIVAETVSLAAGASSLRFAPCLLAAAAGCLPTAAAYAATGSVAPGPVAGAIAFLAVVGVAAAALLRSRAGRAPEWPSLSPGTE